MDSPNCLEICMLRMICTLQSVCVLHYLLSVFCPCLSSLVSCSSRFCLMIDVYCESFVTFSHAKQIYSVGFTQYIFSASR